MSGSTFFEGNAFIDGGQAQNILVTSSSIASSIITTSSLDMNLANIKRVKDPILAQDAATKNYVDLLGIVLTTISLNGSTQSQVSSYQKGSFVITVSNSILNGPSGVFHVTKNEASRDAHIVRTVSSPGYMTNISLKINWPTNSGIYLYKTGPNFDGSYNIKIM